MCATMPLGVAIGGNRVFSAGSLVYSECCTTPRKKTGAEMIADERMRQLFSGHSATDDDEYEDQELASTAACYAFSAARATDDIDDGENPLRLECDDGSAVEFPDGMSWNVNTSDRKGMLAKAGAFCAAEIDRLTRLEERRAAERATLPRRFKYAYGIGVFDPSNDRFNWTHRAGNHGTAEAADTFIGFEWIDE